MAENTQEKKESMVKLQSVRMTPTTITRQNKDGESYESTCVKVVTDLPKSVTDSKNGKGVLIVPAKLAYMPKPKEGAKNDTVYGSAALGYPNEKHSIQYENDKGERVTAKFTNAELVEAHNEAQAERAAARREKAAAELGEKENQAEAGVEMEA